MMHLMNKLPVTILIADYDEINKKKLMQSIGFSQTHLLVIYMQMMGRRPRWYGGGSGQFSTKLSTTKLSIAAMWMRQATFQSSLPNDILFRNALPFLELPSVHLMGRNRWAVKRVLVSRENKRHEAKETGMHGWIWCFDRYGTSDRDMFLLDSSDLDELTTQIHLHNY